MPRLNSETLGDIEFEEECVFLFPAGLPGFEDERRFVPVERPGFQPLVFLQSAVTRDLCFITLPVRTIAPDYHLTVEDEDRAALELHAEGGPELWREALCLAILTALPGQPTTANLMAPVVVNMANRRGMQVLQWNSSYSYQHPLPGVDNQDKGAPGCFVIRRREGESLLIGDDIEIQVVELGGGRVKLGISAPQRIPIVRKEIKLTNDQNVAAARGADVETLAGLVARLRSGRPQVE